VECSKDEHCTGRDDHCSDIGTCVECSEHDHCPQDASICTRNGNCVECSEPEHCTEDAPFCMIATGTCVECFNPGDCPEGHDCVWRCEDEEDADEVCELGRFVCKPLQAADF
jgi:hypothetical protein